MSITKESTTTETLERPALNNKNLVADRLWNRLVNRIVKEGEVEQPYAERVMDQALGFLRLCAEEPGMSYSPSEAVDVGWHTFILYTQDYARFCSQTLGGDFIHHEPNDEDDGNALPAGEFLDTAAAMRRRGIAVDDELWALDAKCAGGRPCESHDCRRPQTEVGVDFITGQLVELAV